MFKNFPYHELKENPEMWQVPLLNLKCNDNVWFLLFDSNKNLGYFKRSRERKNLYKVKYGKREKKMERESENVTK